MGGATKDLRAPHLSSPSTTSVPDNRSALNAGGGALLQTVEGPMVSQPDVTTTLIVTAANATVGATA